jgi:glycosyltransferase involved in cell wall biosynthesis
LSVSAIIPAYNAEKTLRSAIDSALSQDFPDLEVVVVNDGSTDSTRSIVEGYSPRITVVNQENRGASASRNAGVRAAGGEYVAFLDADDLWARDKVSRTCAALDSNPKASLAFSDYTAMVPGRELNPYTFAGAPSMEEMLTRLSDILPSTVVVRRGAFDACGGFSEEFRCNHFEDCWLWIRAREQGEFEYVRGALTTYRSHEKHPNANYLANGKTFIRLVRERYGTRARALISDTRRIIAAVAMHEALRRMDLVDRRGALQWWMNAVRFKPALILDPRISRRVFRARNLRRLLRTFAPSTRVRGGSSHISQ